jgi:ribosomal protein S18 acetylase RimI-like enzyme
MDELRIRRGQARDAATIVAFNAAMAHETEHLALDLERLQRGVVAALSDPAKGFYLVAETAAGRVVGQLMITFEWSDWRNGNFWWIQSVYVATDARGAGVYKRLYEAVRRAADEAGNVCGIRLYVERDNKRAQEVYRRQGMQPTAYEMFEVDFTIQRS